MAVRLAKASIQIPKPEGRRHKMPQSQAERTAHMAAALRKVRKLRRK